jgi:hypothetical protein
MTFIVPRAVAACCLALAVTACQSAGREPRKVCQISPNSAGVMFEVCRQGNYVEYTRLGAGPAPSRAPAPRP